MALLTCRTGRVSRKQEVDAGVIVLTHPCSVSMVSPPLPLGIFYTAAIVGPAAGYLLGGYFLNMYTEIHLT